jgi:Tfp pilus assembly protein PilO
VANKAGTDSKQQLSSNNLIVVMLLITFLVVGISVLVSKALITSIRLDTKVVSAKGKAEKQLKEDITAAPKLVDAYAALGSQAGVLADALPNTSDFPSLIVTLENMTAGAGIRLKAVAPSLAAAATDSTGAPVATTGDNSLEPTPQSYPFSITLDGNYPALLKLLDELEKSARPMRIMSMVLNGSGSTMSAQMEMETFYQDKAELPFGKETIK